jgi:N-acetylglucosaminyl-diphospho-decaprenol L-rhamnosyltransferase
MTGREVIAPWPSVTIVFRVYHRREMLRESLRRMLLESDYEGERVDVIVVDNASEDGSGEMVRGEFPEVRLIVQARNVGVSGWNAGLAAARGDYLLMLDDDCYLPPDGLRLAVAAARHHDADLVSFKVASTADPNHVFTEAYPTGLFTFWGCAVLLRREVYETIGGYDPDIFVWANELEFTLRCLDHGFRHLHLPTVVAQHMKAPLPLGGPVDWRAYRFNERHFAYIAAKLLHPRDAAGGLIARLTRVVLDSLAMSPRALGGVPASLAGAARGLRRRDPLKNAEISRFYRANFETFASPWVLARPIGELIQRLPSVLVSRATGGKRHGLLTGRREDFFEARASWYPEEPAVLAFEVGGAPRGGGPDEDD